MFDAVNRVRVCVYFAKLINGIWRRSARRADALINVGGRRCVDARENKAVWRDVDVDVAHAINLLVDQCGYSGPAINVSIQQFIIPLLHRGKTQ